jgi:hypothetical protein
VLALSKGNKRHRQLGYSYVGSMAVMLATSFAIYRQFHSFGIFHVAALLSSITLCAGIVPVLRKKPALSWQQLHYGFMYLSVLELYVALMAEVLVRKPDMAFWQVVNLSTATVLLPGAALFTRFYKRWQELSYRAQSKSSSAISVHV